MNLEALLTLLQTLVDGDEQARAIVADQRRTLQIELRSGPVVHLEIDRGRIRHGLGPHPRPSVRLEYPTAERLNAGFAGQPVIPELRKGLLAIGFLKNQFPALTTRLAYYMRGTGRTSRDPSVMALVTRLHLRAMVAAVPALARHDGSVAAAVQGMPAGRLLIRVAPNGPWGTIVKMPHGPLSYTFEEPVVDALATVEFRDPDSARALLGGAVSFAATLEHGDVVRTGSTAMIERVSEIVTRFEGLMGA